MPIAVFPCISYPNRVPLSSFYSHPQNLSSDGSADYLLNILYGEAMPGNFLPVDIDLQIGFANHPVCKYGSGTDASHLAYDGRSEERRVRKEVRRGGATRV